MALRRSAGWRPLVSYPLGLYCRTATFEGSLALPPQLRKRGRPNFIGRGGYIGTLRAARARMPLEAMAMLWTILVILVVLWLLGFSFNIGGGLIHLLLVIALIILVVQLVQMLAGRRG